MNKLMTKIVGAALGLTMAIGVGVAVANVDKETLSAEALGNLLGTYEITAASTVTKSAGAPGTATWDGGAKTAALSNGKTFSITGLSSYNISDVAVSIRRSGNSKAAVTFTWKFDSESGTAVSYNSSSFTNSSSFHDETLFTGLTKNGTTFSFVTSGTGSSMYLESVKLYGSTASSNPSLSLSDDEITVAKGEDATFTVTASHLKDNFSVSGGNDTYFTTSYTASKTDGNHTVTLHGVKATTSPITLTVSSTDATDQTIDVTVVEPVVYEKVTSNSLLKDGSQFIIGTTDGTAVCKKYVSGNNCASLTNVPNASGNLLETSLPDDTAIFTISSTTGGWTLTDQDDQEYVGVSGNNYFKVIANTSDVWTISVSNSGVATITSSNSSRVVKKNTNSALFATYTSGQDDISIYMVPSTEPFIGVEVTDGTTSLGVNDTVTLEATLHNTEGTVTWTLVNNTPTGSGNVAQISTNGNEVTVTGKKDGTVKVRASFTDCEDVDTLITVTKALSSIAVTTAPTKTTYTEGESFSTTGMVVTATYDDGSTATPNDYTYSPSGALTPSDTSITISYGGQTTTQDITVNAKTVDHIKIKSLPTKHSYHSGDDFVSDGLTITVCYNQAETDIADDVATGFTISPASYKFTAADETAGSKQFTVTYGGKSATFNVTVAGITGLLDTGWYYIGAEYNDSVYYIPNGQYAGGKAANNAPALDYDSSVYGQSFYFELVADDTYEISYQDSTNNNWYNIVLINNNSGISIQAKTEGNASQCRWTLEENGNGYKLLANDGSNALNRRMAHYNGTDWRAYLTSTATVTNGTDVLFIESENDKFANDFVDSYASGCNSAGSYTSLDWSTAKSAFESLHDGSEFTDAEYTISGSGAQTVVTKSGDTRQNVAEAVAKYDYIVTKYNNSSSVTFNEFMGRVEAGKISYASAANMFGIVSSSNTTIIIVIVSLASISAFGAYLFLRKRKEQ